MSELTDDLETVGTVIRELVEGGVLTEDGEVNQAMKRLQAFAVIATFIIEEAGPQAVMRAKARAVAQLNAAG